MNLGPLTKKKSYKTRPSLKIIISHKFLVSKNRNYNVCSSIQLQKDEDMVGLQPNLPSWTSCSSTRVDFQGNVSSVSESMSSGGKEGRLEQPHRSNTLSDANLSLGERAFSAAGAAVLSAILVNPLNVAETRLQAQAAGVPYQGPCLMTSLETNKSRRKILELVSEEADVASVLGANFSAGFIAGSFAATATCPLDVAKTQRQIEVSVVTKGFI